MQFFTSLNVLADEYVPCSNCSEAQAKAKAKNSSEPNNTIRVHVFDVMTEKAYSYDVTEEGDRESGSSWVFTQKLPSNADLTAAVTAYNRYLSKVRDARIWSSPTLASGVTYDGPIAISSTIAGGVGVALSDQATSYAVSTYIRGAMTIPIAELTNPSNVITTMIAKMFDKVPFYVPVIFPDGTTATFKLVNPTGSVAYEYVEGSAKNADGSPYTGNGSGNTGGGTAGGGTGGNSTSSNQQPITVCNTGYINGVNVGRQCWTYYIHFN